MCNYLKLTTSRNLETHLNLYSFLASMFYEEPVIEEERTFLHYNFFFKNNLKYYWTFRLNFNPAYSFSKKYKMKFFKKAKVFNGQDRYFLSVSLKFFLRLLDLASSTIPNLTLNLLFRSLNFIFFNNIKTIMEFFISDSRVDETNVLFSLNQPYYWARYTKKLNSLKKRRKFNATKRINFLKLDSNFFSRKLNLG